MVFSGTQIAGEPVEEFARALEASGRAGEVTRTSHYAQLITKCRCRIRPTGTHQAAPLPRADARQRRLNAIARNQLRNEVIVADGVEDANLLVSRLLTSLVISAVKFRVKLVENISTMIADEHLH